jgi:hypothetical protein
VNSGRCETRPYIDSAIRHVPSYGASLGILHAAAEFAMLLVAAFRSYPHLSYSTAAQSVVAQARKFPSLPFEEHWHKVLREAVEIAATKRAAALVAQHAALRQAQDAALQPSTPSLAAVQHNITPLPLPRVSPGSTWPLTARAPVR